VPEDDPAGDRLGERRHLVLEQPLGSAEAHETPADDLAEAARRADPEAGLAVGEQRGHAVGAQALGGAEGRDVALRITIEGHLVEAEVDAARGVDLQGAVGRRGEDQGQGVGHHGEPTVLEVAQPGGGQDLQPRRGGAVQVWPW